VYSAQDKLVVRPLTPERQYAVAGVTWISVTSTVQHADPLIKQKLKYDEQGNKNKNKIFDEEITTKR
jgi:hypothetical protein